MTKVEPSGAPTTNDCPPDVEGGSQGAIKLTPTRFNLVVFSLLLSIFVASMDNTIVSTALTTITSDFNALGEVTWVITSYLLTSTAMEPLYGKFSDIFGRKETMLFAITIFLIGSIVCGLAKNLIVLIVFRAVAGIGGGGLISLSMIIISDIVPLHKRGIYLACVGATFALASVIGPLIGGALTDYLSWRWAFYINLPVCCIAGLAIYFILPDISKNEDPLQSKISRIDYMGTLSLLAFTTLQVLGLTWGGNEYLWSSANVICPIVFGLFLLVVFIVVELKFAKEPIFPLRMFNNNVISACVTAFFNGTMFFSVINYTSIYYQLARGISATAAGLELLPLVLGLVVSAMCSGIFISKTGIYRPLSRIGTLIILLGVCLMGGLMRPDITRAESILYLLICGLGIGLCMQTNLIICQASVLKEDTAVVVSLVNFTQSMGGVIGLAIVGSVYQNILSRYLNSHLPIAVDIREMASSAGMIEFLDDATKLIISNAYVESFRYIFITSIGFIVIAFISTLFLKHIPLSNQDNDCSNISEVKLLSH